MRSSSVVIASSVIVIIATIFVIILLILYLNVLTITFCFSPLHFLKYSTFLCDHLIFARPSLFDHLSEKVFDGAGVGQHGALKGVGFLLGAGSVACLD